ncbi:hypothetical protein DUI87_12874 [Hirundo rustica rustica]|uniref:Uncharacterized protein n=1 Tax=Hirundo rustica rustica TaxID=333673 RepID=A0A3M0KA60_HIRRU|nr:hypothetical protein DUI87_12874 [Hirundo rustica rustica]
MVQTMNPKWEESHEECLHIRVRKMGSVTISKNPDMTSSSSRNYVRLCCIMEECNSSTAENPNLDLVSWYTQLLAEAFSINIKKFRLCL